MSFLEWWGETVNPGKRGTIAIGEEHEQCSWKPLVFARFIFVVLGLPILWWLAIPHVPLPFWQAAAAVVGGTLIYVALSYLIDPRPELDNLGIAHGLIDHPCRYSDDVNRFLLGARLVLGPGRFMAESILDMLALVCQEEEDSSSRPQQ